MSVNDENDYAEDTTTVRTSTLPSVTAPILRAGAGSTSTTDLSGTDVTEDVTEREFDMKFRHVDFTDSFSRVNVAHANTPQQEADNKLLGQDEKTVRLAMEEQKVLSSTHLEPKSPDSLRTARIQSSAPGGHHTARHAHNEKQFQHLEDVFQMISPFDSQEQEWVRPDRALEVIRSTSPQNRLQSKAHFNRSGARRPRIEHLVPTLTSLRLRDRCSASCTCVCHSQAHIGRGALSAFKTALGTFTFIFNTRSPTVSCNVPTCVSRKGQYLQVIYTFPAWLFHAAISATVKDWTMGSPELLLRVHRRIDASSMSVYTSIFGFVTRGDVENVKRILSRREASIYDVAGMAGVSLLYHALRLRQMDVVELLICEGADVFQLDDAGLGPYHEAIQVMYTSASSPFQERLQGVLPMDQIMEAGQFTNLHKIAMRILWTSVADYVALNGFDDVNAGDSNNQTPLFYAAAQGNASVVQALLEAGASPDGVAKGISSTPKEAVLSWTPLSMAARDGHLDVVQQLLRAGAQANLRSKHNRTALHECSPVRGDTPAQDTFLEVASCLLAHGADLDVLDNYGSTVLDTTCIRDHARVAAFFIEQGIDTTHRDWEGTNALGNCIGFNSLECAALLLSLGRTRSGVANIDDNGSSNLHYLALGGSAEMMNLLADSGFCGLDADLKDNQGRTALDVLNARFGLSEDLRKAFMRCLHSMSRPEATDLMAQDNDSDSDSLEFFDANESRDGPIRVADD